MAVNNRLCFLRCGHPPHLVEGVHVERQIIELAFVIGYGGVGVAVELYDVVDKIPYLTVAGMEDMGTVFVYVDAFLMLTIYIAAKVSALVDDQAAFSMPVGKKGKGGSIESRAYNKVVVFHGMWWIVCFKIAPQAVPVVSAVFG